MQVLVLTCLILFLSSVYVRKVEPNWVQVTRMTVTVPRLAPEFENYRMVHITDIHADNWMTTDRLRKVIRLINQQHPDLVLLTGDYVTRSPEKYVKTLTTAFKQLTPKDQAIAVLGNHDAWTNPTLIRQALQDGNVTVLENQIYTVERDHMPLHIAGLGDMWAKKADLETVLMQLPKEGPAILLVHEPDFADISAGTGRFALQLSGHSHGGQVSLPFLPPPVVPPLAKNYPSGRYQIKNMIQYTNRGVGMVHPRIRFNCRPEIAVVTLKRDQPAARAVVPSSTSRPSSM